MLGSSVNCCGARQTTGREGAIYSGLLLSYTCQSVIRGQVETEETENGNGKLKQKTETERGNGKAKNQ